MNSQIMRLNRPINQINDSVIGGVAGIDGVSKFAGQLGMSIDIIPENLIFAASVGTLYGGRYQYVKFRAADTPVYTVGQIMFWDTTVTDWTEAYQVTREEDLSSTANAIMIAGIFLGTVEAGNYGLIQTRGVVPVKFRATLTAAGAVGSQVYAAAAGDGVDEGYADVIASGNPTLFSDVSLMQARYLGDAIAAPTNGSTTAINLKFTQVMG